MVRVELRNEALETHCINHIELLAVSHPPGQVLLFTDRCLMRTSFFAAVVIVMGAAGCVWGTRPTELTVARGPRGDSVTVKLRVSQAWLQGELYAVDSIAMIVASPEVTRIPWTLIAAVSSRGLHREYSTSHGSLAPAARAELRTISRFPQGLDGTLLDTVLVLRHQAAIKVIQ